MKGKGPVVHLDRLPKAKMIEAVLHDFLGKPVQGFRILDFGAGNGDISEYFAEKNEQYSVDVKDQRRRKDSKAEFTLIGSESLPFKDNFFDIILSHQVIEHVGNQDLYLEETRRVLKKEGICYLGTPNKSSLLMQGHIGNKKVLKYHMMEPLFRKHGFQAYGYTARLLKEPDKLHCEIRAARFIPKILLNRMKFIFPSHCFILKAIEK